MQSGRWPQSLLGRVGLILFAGLAAAHVLSFWLIVTERSMAMGGMMVSYLASDVASSTAMLERLPPAERDAWLPRLERPNYRLALTSHSQGPASSSPLARSLVHAVATVWTPPRQVRAVDLGDPGTFSLQLALADGTPLSVIITRPGLKISPWVLAVLAAQLALLAGLSWLAVSLATRPLEQLARAADALNPARLPSAPLTTPLPERGPSEVTRAATAFNAMQQRIQKHLDERMQILAAVSHDLQTPITRLRLRADLLDDTALRDKLHADLLEMQALVEQGISYARSAHAAQEPEQLVDIRALLESMTRDHTDAGQHVTLDFSGHTQDPPSYPTRPHALRRLVSNLVENAIKFAGAAEVKANLNASGTLSICVLDRGPGIPPDQLTAVMQPFYRLETSRNRGTGGTGLGLAIAQQLALVLGANLTLSAREGGGLQACLVIERTDDLQ